MWKVEEGPEFIFSMKMFVTPVGDTEVGDKRRNLLKRRRKAVSPTLTEVGDSVSDRKAEQEQRYHADAWDACIDRWLLYERRRVNHGYGSYDDWRDEEVERSTPLTDVSVGEILEGALGIEPARWTKADQMRVGAYLKAGRWE
ncbi:MAG: hypothetical protein P8Y71_00515 [Pseudolabrys sp.]|jgi:hypothetical protein